jgi:alpha-beta hydrolase superfamily lysophospholipase
MTATSNQPNTIVLIPGLWLSATSWEHWVERYQDRGFQVLARNWPGLEGEVEALRDDPSPAQDIGFDEIVDHYEKLVRSLGLPPIIMGHSFGGSVVEILLDRGVGAVGVAIDPGPIKGVLKLPVSSLKSASPGLRNPKKPPPRCDADTRRVPLRVHEHLE